MREGGESGNLGIWGSGDLGIWVLRFLNELDLDAMSSKPKKADKDKEKDKKDKKDKEKSRKSSDKGGEVESKDIDSAPDAPAAAAVSEPERPRLTDPSLTSLGQLPGEYGSGRILTHFVETANVAIAASEVETHRAMGYKVFVLAEYYKQVYDQLRVQLTTQLYPKREQLLSVHRQLRHRALDLEAGRKSIEKDTLTDCEQILERLRGVESMRQSALKHELLSVEEALQAIERLVLRVERANVLPGQLKDSSTVLLLTSANPSSGPLEGVRAPRAIEMVELIQEHSHLQRDILHMAGQVVKVQVDFPTDDFPRETKERLEVISKVDKFVHALHVKDQMLYTALLENEELKMQLANEKALVADYANEMGQWADTAHGLREEMLRDKADASRLQQIITDMQRVLRANNIYYEVPRDY